MLFDDMFKFFCLVSNDNEIIWDEVSLNRGTKNNQKTVILAKTTILAKIEFLAVIFSKILKIFDRGSFLEKFSNPTFQGLSFSLFAKEMVNIANVRIIAPDVRGHGSTLCQDESNLSIERKVST